MRVFSLLCGLLLSATLLAHQQQESDTSLRFNPRSGNLEIVHRFYAHDAEHAVRHILGKEADLFKSAQTRGQFAAYVHNHFGLKNADGGRVQPELLGEEIEGKFIWVYQEIPGMTVEAVGEVKATFFFDIWPRYQNVVALDLGKNTQALRLKKGDVWQSIKKIEAP